VRVRHWPRNCERPEKPARSHCPAKSGAGRPGPQEAARFFPSQVRRRFDSLLTFPLARAKGNVHAEPYKNILFSFCPVLACFWFLLLLSQRKSWSLSEPLWTKAHSPIPGATIHLYATPGLIAGRKPGLTAVSNSIIWFRECTSWNVLPRRLPKISRRIVVRDRSETLDLTLGVADSTTGDCHCICAAPNSHGKFRSPSPLGQRRRTGEPGCRHLERGLRRFLPYKCNSKVGQELCRLTASAVSGQRTLPFLQDGFRFLDPFRQQKFRTSPPLRPFC